MVGSSAGHVVLTVGSCAAGHRESGQVRKEAALSDRSRVPQGCLTRAVDPERAGYGGSTAGGTITQAPWSSGSHPILMDAWESARTDQSLAASNPQEV